jgi:hypothetical protein
MKFTTEVFDHDASDEVKASRKGYCSRCYHTFWKNEVVVKRGELFIHTHCGKAIADRTPRVLNPEVARIIGDIDKSILKKKVKRVLLSMGADQ